MEIEQIRALCEMMAQNGITRLQIEQEGGSVTLERAPAAAPTTVLSAPVLAAPIATAPVEPLPAVPPAPSPALPEAAPAPAGGVDFNNLTEVKSPMVGVFYAAPSPDSEPFVRVGSRVKKGDVLCIIEAMKLMNEITAECDGEIVDICAQNGDIVEFSQVLFKIC